MTEKRATYRHRNSKNHSVVPELIFTFWVGQRVCRSWERRDYFDKIGQTGTVSELPQAGQPYLRVLLDSGETVTWSPTECTPIRKLHERNRKRFLSVAKNIAHHLSNLDENGAKK